jgi:amidase
MTDLDCVPPSSSWRCCRRATSARELLDHYVARVERLNPALNAVVTLDVERARAADAADQARARAILGPLHGLPMTIKDTLETRVSHDGGATMLAEHVPATDAIVVERVRAAGASSSGRPTRRPSRATCRPSTRSSA